MDTPSHFPAPPQLCFLVQRGKHVPVRASNWLLWPWTNFLLANESDLSPQAPDWEAEPLVPSFLSSEGPGKSWAQPEAGLLPTSPPGGQLNRWLQLVPGVGHVVEVTEKHQHKQALLMQAEEMVMPWPVTAL